MSKFCPACHHLHPNGRRCGSPALRGEQFCFFHHPTRRPPTRTPSRTAFDIPAIVDAEDLQIALSEVIRRLADNTLDPKRAGLLLATLQLAKANLPNVPDYSRIALTQANGSGGRNLADLSGLLARLGSRPTPTAPGL